MQYTYNNQMGSRSRKSWLLLIKDNTITVFGGSDIPEMVVVVGTDYKSNGKWSSTTYRLAIAKGVRIIDGMDGWETGTFREGLRSAVGYNKPIDRWIELANALGVSMGEAQRFLREFRPNEAERLDKIEALLGELEEESDEEQEEISITFGAPSRRMMNEGFWELPVFVIKDGEIIGKLVPDEYRDYHPEGDIVVVATEYRSGYHGGYMSFRVMAPTGAKMVHGWDMR